MINLTGQIFGLLQVIKPTVHRSGNQIMWQCRCSCGSLCNIRSASLRLGLTKSCGCIRKEQMLKLGKRSKIGKLNPAYKQGLYCDPTKFNLVRIKRREDYLKKMYGITLKEYMSLYKAQGGRCKICGLKQHKVTGIQKATKGLIVDHSHKTGKVRGLLCTGCNLILGNCHDSKDTLYNAIKYLKESTC